MSDYRRANYVPLTRDRVNLDLHRAKYNDIRFVLPAVRTFVVTDAFAANLPGLAHELWGEVGLWWVIGMYNGLIDPIADLQAGLVLRVPDVAKVKALLESSDADNAVTNVVEL